MADAADRHTWDRSADAVLADDRHPPDAVATHPMRSPMIGLTNALRWEGAGTVVGGRYALLECVGEGGMGAVWSAQQTSPVRRLVAVKLLRGGSDSKRVVARFEAERQALAVMDHPNIAKILDGGVTDAGSPYFVMEYVKGVPITHFCDQRKLTPRARLELFAAVCDAIQHAHQKGIIHRDIKPSNVLVALDGDRPVPKVIDFGVAKATGPALTDLTLNTGLGVVVGTPQYMSPEQASLTGFDIDTRSDVYSLGVLLYELLAGSPPFVQRNDSCDGVLEILRLIREENPPRPSTKIGTADALPALSERRGTDAKKLAGVLRGDLDWVVLKALEKDRARRYDTAAAFAADVRRYLAGDAVLAHPPGLRYRLGKTLRKNRGPAAVAAAFVVTHVAGLTATTVGLIRTDAARAAEADQRVVAEAGRVRAEAAEALAEDRRKDAVAAQKRTMTALRAATGEDVERLLGSRTELGPHERAYLQAIIERWQVFARSGGETPEARAVAAEGAARVAGLRVKLGDQAAAVAGYRVAVAAYESLARDFPDVPGYRRDLAANLTMFGNVLGLQGERDLAAAQYRRGIDVLEPLAEDSPDYRFRLAGSRNNFGHVLTSLSKPAEAEEQYRRCLDALEELAAASPGPTRQVRELSAVCRGNLANVLTGRGRGVDAVKQYRRVIADQEQLSVEFPDVRKYRVELASCRSNLAILLSTQGDRPGAEDQYRRAIRGQESLAAEFPAVPKYAVGLGRYCSNLGRLLNAAAQWPEALAYHDRAVAALTTASAAQAGDVNTRGLLRDAHVGRAAARTAAGLPAEAAADFDRAIDLSPAAERADLRTRRAESQPVELAPPPRDAR